jgi:DNA-binding NarL/FixJ family response regulator
MNATGDPRVPQSAPSGHASGIGPLPSAVVRTFIVEDSPIILDNLIATLEEMAPVQVVGSAPDEATAMQRLSQMEGEIDLVIIDVFLKSGSGLGVLRGTTQAGLGAKRVVLTNYATPDMREKCKALGANRVFDKSNDLDDLISYCTRLAGDYTDTSSGTLL